MKIAIIVSEFNCEVTDHLLESAIMALQKAKFTTKEYEIFRVPGAFEIPYFASKLAHARAGSRPGATKKYIGIIALGAIIKGRTDHYEAVCAGVTYGIQKVSIETGVPVMFGVLMCKNEKLAKARLNKGAECVEGLLKLLKTDAIVES